MTDDDCGCADANDVWLPLSDGIVELLNDDEFELLGDEEHEFEAEARLDDRIASDLLRSPEVRQLVLRLQAAELYRRVHGRAPGE